MPDLTTTLRTMADLISRHGINRTQQYLDPNGTLDLSLSAWVAIHGTIPAEFADDYVARDAIEADADAMAALVAISNSLDTEPPVCEELVDGRYVEVTEYVEHLYSWTSLPGIGGSPLPNVATIVGRLLRLADDIDARNATQYPHAA